MSQQSAVFLCFALMCAACSSGQSGNDAAAGKCVEGQAIACACTNGAKGAQTCEENGTFASCICDGSQDGGGSDDGMPGSGTPDAHMMAGPPPDFAMAVSGNDAGACSVVGTTVNIGSTAGGIFCADVGTTYCAFPAEICFDNTTLNISVTANGGAAACVGATVALVDVGARSCLGEVQGAPSSGAPTTLAYVAGDGYVATFTSPKVTNVVKFIGGAYDGSVVPVTYTFESSCAATQCGGACCASGDSCVQGACCAASRACGGTCCATGDSCVNGSCCVNCGSECCALGTYCVAGSCCPSDKLCGAACCSAAQTCVTPIISGPGSTGTCQ